MVKTGKRLCKVQRANAKGWLVLQLKYKDKTRNLYSNVLFCSVLLYQNCIHFSRAMLASGVIERRMKYATVSV